MKIPGALIPAEESRRTGLGAGARVGAGAGVVGPPVAEERNCRAGVKTLHVALMGQ